MTPPLGKIITNQQTKIVQTAHIYYRLHKLDGCSNGPVCKHFFVSFAVKLCHERYTFDLGESFNDVRFPVVFLVDCITNVGHPAALAIRLVHPVHIKVMSKFYRSL